MNKIITLTLTAIFIAGCATNDTNNTSSAVEQPRVIVEPEPEPEPEPQRIEQPQRTYGVETVEESRANSARAVQDAQNDIDRDVRNEQIEQIDLDDDLSTLPGEGWRPRDFDYPAQCDEAGENSRLMPSIWFDEFQDTDWKVREQAGLVFTSRGNEDITEARDALGAVGSHINLWEYWCPPTGMEWRDAHTILLVGLWYLEDSYYFLIQYNGNNDPRYLDRAWLAHEEGIRYIDRGVREALVWYGDIPEFGWDEEYQEDCIRRGFSHIHLPLCEDYWGPLLDPDHFAYWEDARTVAEDVEYQRQRRAAYAETHGEDAAARYFDYDPNNPTGE